MIIYFPQLTIQESPHHKALSHAPIIFRSEIRALTLVFGQTNLLSPRKRSYLRSTP